MEGVSAMRQEILSLDGFFPRRRDAARGGFRSFGGLISGLAAMLGHP